MTKPKLKFKLKRSEDDARDLNFHINRFVNAAKLPESYTVPFYRVKNQGSYGACSGFAGTNAYETSLAMNVKPGTPVPVPETAWLRAAIYDSVTKLRIVNSKPYVLIDKRIEAWGQAGTIVCEVPKEIVAKGVVEVVIWVEKYKAKTFSIDFTRNETQSRAAYMFKGVSVKPNPENPATIPNDVPSEMDEIPDNVPLEILPVTKTFWEQVQEFLLMLYRIVFPLPITVSSMFKVEEFSPKWNYSKSRERYGNFKDQGVTPKHAVEVMVKTGLVPEILCKYVPPIPQDLRKETGLLEIARKNKAISYHRLWTVDEVKTALYNGMGVTISIWEAILINRLKVMDFPKWYDPAGETGHILTVIGWDEKGLLILNSWGGTFGVKGTARIGYDSGWLTKANCELWAIRTV